MISLARGTSLTMGTKKVAHLTKIGSPSIKTDTVETTALDNTTGFKEFMAAFSEGGEVSISGNFDFADEGQKILTTAMASKEKQTCTIDFPTAIGAKWEFEAYVTSFNTSAETTGLVGFDAGLTVTGQPTLSAAD